MLKKSLKIISEILLVLFLVILVDISLDNYILPKLSQYRYWSRFAFVQRVNKPVKVINKIEKISVPEDKSIQEVASQASTALVNIISLPSSQISNFKTNLQKKTNIIFPQNSTGIILTSDGLIVGYKDFIKTEENTNYKIITFDEKIYDAKLVWIDEFSNLVYLKIDGVSSFPTIALANSNDSSIGQTIIAMSNKKSDYQNYLANGVIEGKDKSFNLSPSVINFSDKLEGVLAVSINNPHDFDGGSIINYQGEMVGLLGSLLIDNQRKYFAISSNKIKESFNFYLNYQENHKKRAQLGVYYISLNKSLALANHLEDEKGALIYSPSGRQGLAVLQGSAGMKAGLKVGDIVRAVNDQKIDLEHPLSNLIAQYHQGDEINLKVKRNGKEIDLKVNF